MEEREREGKRPFGGVDLGRQSGSLDIISNKVGLDRAWGGGDIGLRSPAVRAELKLVKLEG